MLALPDIDTRRDTMVKNRALVALVALFLLQIIYAGHQFDHAADDLSAACGICLQLDRIDDGVQSASIEINAFQEIPLGRTINAQSFDLRTTNSVSARGPPSV